MPLRLLFNLLAIVLAAAATTLLAAYFLADHMPAPWISLGILVAALALRMAGARR